MTGDVPRLQTSRTAWEYHVRGSLGTTGWRPRIGSRRRRSEILSPRQRGAACGRRARADAPALGASGLLGPEGHQVRLRCGAVRRLHGAARRPAHSLVHHADLRGWQGRGHHHRELAARRIASAAARLAGPRRAAVRLLPGGSAHGRVGAAQGHAEPDRRADRRGDERQRLPLRYLHAHQAGDQVGGRRRGRA